jgi:hypothetical protein
MGRACSVNGGRKRSAYRILAGNPKGNRPLGRPRRKWVGNVEMDLRETVWDGMDWIYLAENRDQWHSLVSMAMNLQVP